jgi:hypothetical protein
MKKFAFLPLAAIVALGACNDATMLVAPEGANFELVDATQKVVNGANIDIYAKFVVEVGTGNTVTIGDDDQPVPGMNSEGKPHGLCYSGGRWQNPSNKKFAAKVPHDHCRVVGEELIVGLESITGKHFTQNHGSGDNRRTSVGVNFNESGTMFVKWNAASGQEQNRKMEAGGIVDAVAVDKDGNPQGTFRFDLEDQYDGDTTNRFADYENETEGGGEGTFGLSGAITATYTYPVGKPGPNGELTKPVSGVIYWIER